MVTWLARSLQFSALVGLPVVALALYNAPVYLFAALGFFSALFFLGRYLEGYTAPHK
ncbi:MAG: hypothetical protein SFX18_04210 [Pirellulales bacterium]|nr:hypothetical protein [Pirellulales bacterium]